MKLSLDKKFKSLSGEELQGMTMGQLLAEAISQSNKGNSIKIYNWALKLYNKEELEMDETDFKTLKDMVESNETLSNIIKAQLILELEKLNG
jgi:hypothetical protein